MFKFVTALFLIVFVCVGGLAFAGSVDLSTWTQNNLNLPGGQSAGNWVVAGDGNSVEEVNNADPSFFVSNVDQSTYTMQGTWRVNTTSDDDFIGFAFGYQDAAHCYIMDWKRSAQSSHGMAQEGLTIRKIHAASEGDLILDNFWSSSDTDNATILATNYGSTMGWVANTDYHFQLDMAPGQFTIVVMQGTTELWNVTVSDATYTDGRFCFYNYSQGHVVYSGFTQTIDPICDAGGPYDGYVDQALTLDGSGSYDIDGQITAWEWDFGDGDLGCGETVDHTYTAEGVYTVNLCVTDDDGATKCCSTIAVITEPVPTVRMSFGQVKGMFR